MTPLEFKARLSACLTREEVERHFHLNFALLKCTPAERVECMTAVDERCKTIERIEQALERV